MRQFLPTFGPFGTSTKWLTFFYGLTYYCLNKEHSAENTVKIKEEIRSQPKTHKEEIRSSVARIFTLKYSFLFQYTQLNTWMITSCDKSGTNACILQTEEYPTRIVQELHIEIIVNTHKPRKDLVIGYKARDYNGVVHQVHHESSIQSHSGQ